jgi:hypothetical protein
MKNCLLVLAIVLATGGQATVCRASTDPCDSLTVPPAISTALEKFFPHWRVEKVSDLHADYQELWTKNYTTNCPGFVVGHLQSPDSKAYAFLLVPADQTKKGCRLVVFSETTKNSWRPIVLEKDDQYTPTSAVIRLAPPGDYEEGDSNKKVYTD